MRLHGTTVLLHSQGDASELLPDSNLHWHHVLFCEFLLRTQCLVMELTIVVMMKSSQRFTNAICITPTSRKTGMITWQSQGDCALLIKREEMLAGLCTNTVGLVVFSQLYAREYEGHSRRSLFGTLGASVLSDAQT